MELTYHIFSPITGEHYLNDSLHKTSFISKFQVARWYKTGALRDHKSMKQEIRVWILHWTPSIHFDI